MQYPLNVIEQMSAKNRSRPEMRCTVRVLPYMKTRKSKRATFLGLVMDIRDLKFDDGTFDVAIDQGNHLAFQTVAPLGSHMPIRIGTMDAMMTAKGDVWVGSTIR